MPEATTPVHVTSEEAVFLAALELTVPEERMAYIDSACGGCSELRVRVLELLESHEELQGAFDIPPTALAFDPLSPLQGTETVGTMIGPYKIREVLGEGGMGIVYAATQERPLRRKVAIKVIKPGMDSKEVIGRFEAERQALALMDHPNIAKVFEAGTTESGRPYFVMELVRGMPITDYCDRANVTLRERLKLFITVCQAIQHAHQKGIIHRDLKPSNVLVTLHDGVPVPKVIDFGVAKAMNQRLTEHTVYTQNSQMVGTPMYMSPEQAELSSLDVDTRSDVYSLGVLLYELLAGVPPFEKERFSRVSFDEMRRMIREDEPPRPSQRVSTMEAKVLSTVSGKRGLDERKLTQSLKGELDWIVMKAVEKDRQRRYESASSFATDVQRYLDDEPVAACPPSVAYRLRKFARRNKATLVTAIIVSSALLVGTAVSSWQAFEATNARSMADGHLTDLKRAYHDLERERTSAESSYLMARAAVQQLLTRVADKQLGKVAEFKEQRQRLLEEAVAFYSKLISLHPQDAQAYFERGETSALLGNYAQARADYEKAVQLVPNKAHYQTILGSFLVFCPDSSVRGSVDEGLSFVKRAIELQPDVAKYHYNVFSVLSILGRKEEANEAIQKAAQLDPTSPLFQARVAQGTAEYSKGLAILQAEIDSNPDELLPYFLALELAVSQGDQKAVVSICSQAIAAKPNDPSTRQFYSHRADIYHRERNFEGGLADESRAIMVAPYSALAYISRGRSYFSIQRYAEWLADLSKAIELDPSYADGLLEVAFFVRISSDEPLKIQALSIANRAVESARKKAWPRAARARILAASGKFDEGYSDLLSARRELPHRGDVENYSVLFYIENASILAARNLWDESLLDAETDVLRGHIYWKIRTSGELAWCLATSKDVNVRRPEQARKFAKLAFEFNSGKPLPGFLNHSLANPTFDLNDVGTVNSVGIPDAIAACGWLAGEEEQFDVAHAEFAKAASSDNARSRHRYLHALLCLKMSDTTAYQRVAARELDSSRNDRSRSRPASMHQEVSLCALGPAAVDDYSGVIEIAKLALKWKPDDSTAVCEIGAAYFRAGQFDDARQMLIKSKSLSEAKGKSSVCADYFLAMTNYRLGNSEEAHRNLTNAVSTTKEMLAESRDEEGELLQWDRRLMIKLLQAEGTALIRETHAETVQPN